MENKNSITFASIKERKESILDIEENLEPQSKCCIYRVPNDLRKMNEEAYTPKVISIGPFHHGAKELADMEKQKIRYAREFSKRMVSVEKTWQELVNFIEENEQLIRNCYAMIPKFGKTDFIMMILYDAVFIIESLLRHYDKSCYMINNPRIRGAISRDMQLLENQLPFFVLKEMYMLVFSDGKSYPSFFHLSCNFIYDRIMFDGTTEEEVEVKHFTDLRRYVITKMHGGGAHPNLQAIDQDLPCVSKLHKSGVKFKKFEGECSSLIDIRFKKKKLLRVPCLKFEVHELKIPRIAIYYETECLIRNMMALEQCHYPEETHICNYIGLMDCLINTEEDVNLLVEGGIILNRVGDTARIKKMFNDLCLNIATSPSCYYHNLVLDLKEHYNNRWNHAKANLRMVYFNNLWRGTRTVAAFLLLLLTLVQTVCSVKSLNVI